MGPEDGCSAVGCGGSAISKDACERGRVRQDLLWAPISTQQRDLRARGRCTHHGGGRSAVAPDSLHRWVGPH
eukprot:1970452-Prymnesium_polylepis.1